MTDRVFNIEANAAPYIPNELPSFYRDGSVAGMAAFLQAYYTWLGLPGNVLANSASLMLNLDIDSTLPAYLPHFERTYLQSFPTNQLPEATIRSTVKHIKDIIYSKGTVAGLQYVFKLVYGAQVTVQRPGDHMFKPSNGTWNVSSYLEVSYTPILTAVVGSVVTGLLSRATAYVDRYESVCIGNNRVVYMLYISEVHGTFFLNEGLGFSGFKPDPNNISLIMGSVAAVAIYAGGMNFNVGDSLTLEVNPNLQVQETVSAEAITANNQFFGVSDGLVVDFALNYLGQPLLTDKVASIMSGNSTSNMTVLANSAWTDFGNGSIQFATAPITGTLHAWSGTGTLAQPQVPFTDTVISAELIVRATEPKNGVVNFVIANSGWGYSNSTTDPDGFTDQTIALTQANSNPGAGANFQIGNLANTENLTVSNNFISSQQSVVLGAEAYNFPANPSANLESTLASTLTLRTVTVGAIQSIAAVNPGAGYNGAVTVTIANPVIQSMHLPETEPALILGNAGFGNGSIEAVSVKQSGIGFVQGEHVGIVGSNGGSVANGIIELGPLGLSAGSWSSTQSFPDYDQYIQDSYYYQDYSFQVSGPISSDVFSSLSGLYHVAGMMEFYRPVVATNFAAITSEAVVL